MFFGSTFAEMWWWENRGAEPVTVTLTAAGFYNVSHEFRQDQPTKNKMFQ